MKRDEFERAYRNGMGFPVNIRGYVVGSSQWNGLNTTTRAGGMLSAEPGESVICAEVRIDGAMLREFHSTFAGTSVDEKKLGGGTVLVPIELLVAEVPA